MTTADDLRAATSALTELLNAHLGALRTMLDTHPGIGDIDERELYNEALRRATVDLESRLTAAQWSAWRNQDSLRNRKELSRRRNGPPDRSEVPSLRARGRSMAAVDAIRNGLQIDAHVSFSDQHPEGWKATVPGLLTSPVAASRQVAEERLVMIVRMMFEDDAITRDRFVFREVDSRRPGRRV